MSEVFGTRPGDAMRFLATYIDQTGTGMAINADDLPDDAYVIFEEHITAGTRFVTASIPRLKEKNDT
jgi:hypothetical protein